MHPTPEADIQFDCPLCGGAFEAPAELLGQEVECPHCGQSVELPTAEELLPAAKPAPIRPVQPEPIQPDLVQPTGVPEAKPTKPQPAAEPEPEPKRPLTREERAAKRKRFNLILALIGGLLLMVAFVVLASLD